MKKAKKGIQLAGNKVKKESKSIAVDKELSMAEFFARIICNSKNADCCLY